MSKKTNADIMGSQLLDYQQLDAEVERELEENGVVSDALYRKVMDYAKPITGSNDLSAPAADMADTVALLESLSETGLDGKLNHSKGIISAAWASVDRMNPPVNVLANDSPTELGAGLFLCKKGEAGSEQDSFLMVVNNNNTGAALLVGDVVVKDSLRHALAEKGLTYVKRGEPGAEQKIATGLARTFEGASPVSYMPLTQSELVGFAFSHQGLEESRFSAEGFEALREQGAKAAQAREASSTAQLVKFLANPGELARGGNLVPALTDGAEFDGLQRAAQPAKPHSHAAALTARREMDKANLPTFSGL